MAVILGVQIEGDAKKLQDAVKKASEAIADMSSKISLAAGAMGTALVGSLGLAARGAQDIENALGEVSSVGIKDLEGLSNAARKFSNEYTGVTAAQFIRSSYDIKSAISSLSDDGVIAITRFSNVTAKATKASADEMARAFTTAYGIFKPIQKDLSDAEWAKRFSSVMATTVQSFRTTGAQMNDALKNLGATGAASLIPLEEQMAILGQLQTVMPGAEAGTQYKAFLLNIGKGAEKLGITVTDASGRLKSLPDILEAIRQKFPDLTQAAQQAELRKALGSEEAYRFVLQMSAGIDQLKGSIVTLTEASTSSSNAAEQMAAAMNTDSYALLAQQIQNLWAQIGQFVNTALGPFLDSTKQAVLEVQRWIETNPELTQQIVEISMYLAAFLLGVSAVAATVAGVITTFTFFAGALAKVSAGLAVLTAGVKGFGVVTALVSAPVVLLVAKILLIVGAVAAVVSAIYYFRHEIMGVFAEVGAFLRDWFVIFYDHAAAAVEKVKGAFVSAFSYVRDFVEGVMNRISNVLQGAWDFVGRLLGRIGQIAFGGEIQAVADLPTSSVNNSVAITVNQQPGESGEALALRVANAIQRRQGR